MRNEISAAVRAGTVAAALSVLATGGWWPPPRPGRPLRAGRRSGRSRRAPRRHRYQGGDGRLPESPASRVYAPVVGGAGAVVIHAIVPDPTLTSMTRRVIYGRSPRVVLTHSPSLHAAQRAGFEQTLARPAASSASCPTGWPAALLGSMGLRSTPIRWLDHHVLPKPARCRMPGVGCRQRR